MVGKGVRTLLCSGMVWANSIPRPQGRQQGMGSLHAWLCQKWSLALCSCACAGGISCRGSAAWRGMGGHQEMLHGYFLAP